jgi:hypothetical protein
MDKRKELEDKMEERRQPGYELSPQSTRPGTPEANAASESNVPSQANVPSESNVPSQAESFDDSVQSALPILFIVSAEFPVVTILCTIYRLCKLDYFKVLSFYFFK